MLVPSRRLHTSPEGAGPSKFDAQPCTLAALEHAIPGTPGTTKTAWDADGDCGEQDKHTCNAGEGTALARQYRKVRAWVSTSQAVPQAPPS